ncbi:hypothetical protein [Sphingomonas sp. 1185]|uniref:phosphoribosyltransferase-like protein n=1 Tax=Sphingomonas sp. 1185 TaxID=3156411 RepID=UPI00339A8ACF
MMSGGYSNQAGGENIALRLPNTTRAKAWLSQFDDLDQEVAVRLLSSLTLVSHSAFERALQSLIEREAAAVEGPVALYATREADPDRNYFEAMGNPDSPFAPLSAVPTGADLGSEARCAALIRNLAKTAKGKFLNHPSLETLRKEHARAIFVVDDIIGSGKRTTEFISAMWHSPSIMSWHSRHQIAFKALAFTATISGERRVGAHRCRPEVITARDCPTFEDVLWPDDIGQKVKDMFVVYGARTSRPKMRLGFADSMAALVFEHGCPNNVPAIFWAPTTKKASWEPLFPDRSILSEEASAFPPDILARDPVAILTELSGNEEGVPAAMFGPAPLGISATTILALVAKGVRSRAALNYAIGYDVKECTAILDRCVARGYLTPALRLTAAGRAELNFDGRSSNRLGRLPPIGSDMYYPRQLRGPPGG